jgi:hypothetical protein
MNHRLHSNTGVSKGCPTGFSASRQRGMSMLGAVFAILLGAFVLTCVLKLGPAYMSNWQIQSILSSMKSEFEQAEMVVDRRAVHRKLSKRFDIDQIDAITFQDVKVSRDEDDVVVNANYESRIPLLANIDVVLKFEDNEVRIHYYGNK